MAEEVGLEDTGDSFQFMVQVSRQVLRLQQAARLQQLREGTGLPVDGPADAEDVFGEACRAEMEAGLMRCCEPMPSADKQVLDLLGETQNDLCEDYQRIMDYFRHKATLVERNRNAKAAPDAFRKDRDGLRDGTAFDVSPEQGSAHGSRADGEVRRRTGRRLLTRSTSRLQPRKLAKQRSRGFYSSSAVSEADLELAHGGAESDGQGAEASRPATSRSSERKPGAKRIARALRNRAAVDGLLAAASNATAGPGDSFLPLVSAPRSNATTLSLKTPRDKLGRI